MDLLFIAQSAAQSMDGSSEAGILSDLNAPMQVALLLGALSFATAMLVCVTAFTRIIIVLSFVRRALSTQEIPPNQVLLGLSIFLTMFVMAPTFEAIHRDAITPYLEANRIATQSDSRAAIQSRRRVERHIHRIEVVHDEQHPDRRLGAVL